jgi:hypothetical protein
MLRGLKCGSQAQVFSDTGGARTQQDRAPVIWSTRHASPPREPALHLGFHGKAHTAEDIQVFSPSKKVVAADDAVIGFLPNLNDGYPGPWPKTIDALGALKSIT